jgi:hypothetical protein
MSSAVHVHVPVPRISFPFLGVVPQKIDDGYVFIHIGKMISVVYHIYEKSVRDNDSVAFFQNAAQDRKRIMLVYGI